MKLKYIVNQANDRIKILSAGKYICVKFSMIFTKNTPISGKQSLLEVKLHEYNMQKKYAIKIKLKVLQIVSISELSLIIIFNEIKDKIEVLGGKLKTK
jgi:hypothetical protein